MNQPRIMKNIAILNAFKNDASAAALKDYTGWGGLREAIYTPEIYSKLKKILSSKEIASLKQTLKSAYYTPKMLVDFIYSWLDIYGFQGGAILEPAVGNGTFIEHMPKAMKANSQITAVEIDQVTSAMTKALYPDVDLQQCPFEQFQPAQKYDLIIGNPPYGSDTVNDEQHPDLNGYCIHHYFVAKSMRLLTDNGILAMVLPSYFLDNNSRHVREIIYREGGDLLSAYRLPDNIFSDAKVTVDLVFLKKGRTGAKWLSTRPLQVGDDRRPLNKYFHDHSGHILGNLEVVPIYNRRGLTCKNRGPVSALLQREIQIYRHTKFIATLQSEATALVKADSI